MATFEIVNRSADGSSYFAQEGTFNWIEASIVGMADNGFNGSFTPYDFLLIDLGTSAAGFPHLYARVSGHFSFFNQYNSDGVLVKYVAKGSLINQVEIVSESGTVYDRITGMSFAINSDKTTFSNENANPFATSFMYGEVPVLETVYAGNDSVSGNTGGENLYGWGGNDTISGGDGADRLDGGAGGDSLVGGAGADTLLGGIGNDTISGYTAGDSIDGGADTDTWALTGTYSTGIGLSPTVNLTGVTFYGIEVLRITYGSFVFNPDQIGGSSTVRKVIGGSSYRDAFSVNAVDNGPAQGARIDLSNVTFENWNVNTQDSDTIAINGTSGGDTIDGGSQNDVIRAYEGNNVVRGGGGSDVIYAWQGNDLLVGDQDPWGATAAGGNDTLDGGAGNDTLAGYVGRNVVRGGDGNDTLDLGFTVVEGEYGYPVVFWVNLSTVVDPVATPGVYNAGGNYQDSYDGTLYEVFLDQVIGIENVLGSAYSDELTGDAQANRLSGRAGNDVLTGGGGNDTLDGGTESDAMAGGTGNDVYTIDSLGDGGYFDDGDYVTELPGEGIDTIQAVVSYSLVDTDLWGTNGGNVENLTLLGTGDLNGTGNALNNVLTGNAGANVLTGKAGNDTYVVGAGDTVVEVLGEGTDTVRSPVNWTLGANVERLVLLGKGNTAGTGNELANILTGNVGKNMLLGLDGRDQLLGGTGNDTLDGGRGLDTLSGGMGIDSLTGGANADVFLFDTALSTTTNRDAVTDFQGGVDKVHLDDDVFTAFTGASSLAPGQFAAGAGLNAAQTLAQRVVYNTNTGALYYDADGNAVGGIAAVQVAVFTNKPTLVVTDFVIVG